MYNWKKIQIARGHERHMKAGVTNTKAKTKWHLSGLYLDKSTVTGAVHANSMQTQLMEIVKAYQPFILQKENTEM